MLAVARFKRLARKDNGGFLRNFKEKHIRLTYVFREKGAKNEMREVRSRNLSAFQVSVLRRLFLL
jgi:hypothetical protein